MKFLTLAETWNLLQVTTWREWRKIKDDVPYVKVGNKHLYPEDEVRRFANGYLQKKRYKWWERLPIANSGDYEPSA